MLAWPDWNKLYADWNCLYYGVPFSDEQWEKINKAESVADREQLVRNFREEYMKNRDLATGELKKEPEKVEPETVEEESIEDVKPAKKKGK